LVKTRHLEKYFAYGKAADRSAAPSAGKRFPIARNAPETRGSDLRHNANRSAGPEMTMNASEANYDLVLTGAQICDPATGLDRTCDLAVTGDRIAAVGSGLASRARQVIELDRVAGYSGRYRWQYSAHDSQLLTKAAELESFYTEVVPLVTRA